jgi:hypothetical protein
MMIGTTINMILESNAMDFLIRAQRYTEARGDDNFFCHYYTMYREHFSVKESVRKTIAWLYDDDVADLLEFQ